MRLVCDVTFDVSGGFFHKYSTLLCFIFSSYPRQTLVFLYTITAEKKSGGWVSGKLLSWLYFRNHEV